MTLSRIRRPRLAGSRVRGRCRSCSLDSQNLRAPARSIIGQAGVTLYTVGTTKAVQLAGSGGQRTVALADFFVGYRKTVLAADEVMVSVTIPRRVPRLAGSYKVSKRRELDIAIVSAGFWLELDSAGAVSEVRLAYGGVAAMPSRAHKTEQFLLGKGWNSETIEQAKEILAGEFAPIDDVRAGAAFRRGLIVSLLEKFWLGATARLMPVAVSNTKALSVT